MSNLIFGIMTFLLSLTCVDLPILKTIHHLGSLIFILWLVSLIIILDVVSKARGSEH